MVRFLSGYLDILNIQAALDRSQAIIHFDPNGTILWANVNRPGFAGGSNS